MSSKNKPKPAKKEVGPLAAPGSFDSLVSTIVHLHQQTKDVATKAVNVALTMRNWLIGCRIVEFEQQGNDRAAYGEKLLPALAERLSAAGLKRVDVRELRRFRLLYEVYPQIRESLTPELVASLGVGALQAPLKALPMPKRETPSPETQIGETVSPELIRCLSFSHLAELIELADTTQRRFYEVESIRGNWSVRELRRQIASLYYERSGLSKDKAELSAIAARNGFVTAALQNFVNGMLDRMIFDGEALTNLLAPLDIGWKDRTRAELALMTDLMPILTKRASGRDISGLSAYETQM
jgi:hypothetical protein